MKVKSVVVTSVMAAVLFGISAMAWTKDADEFSMSERRELAKVPDLTVESVMDGTFMEEFKTYALDQFPFRDGFRRLKAETVFQVLGQKDNHEIYVVDGYASKMEYPLSTRMLDHAAERFRFIYEEYLQEAGEIYMAIVPDKNYFLAEESGYLTLDYGELFRYVEEQTEYMTHVDLTGELELSDYYFTDSHWRQEELVDVADLLLTAMGAAAGGTSGPVGLMDAGGYEVVEMDVPFYGVYYGQAALPMEPDSLKYLTSEWLENCVVTCYDTGSPMELPMYDLEKAAGKDPYEMFLSGTRAVLTIENPAVENGKELIVFRDSFGSSLVPLLAQGYEKITVLDIRYVNSAVLGQFVEFGGQDVLFLYSTMLLNNSLALR